MTDAMLIQEYVHSRSQAALGKIVARHMDWVYSAALRMVADGDLAQDVTQAVFLVLMQKAGQLQGKPVNAWLFGVTRFAARHALRARERRRRHERMAAIMIGKSATTNAGQDPNQATWAAIAPLLDELVGRLGTADRRAILLRFYQGKSMAELGSLLGVSEDAAKKRVYKAVKRLRELLASRGVRVPADVLGVVLLDRATQSAPAKLAELCRKPSVQAASGAASIASGVIRMMALTKLKVAALTVATIGLIPTTVALALLAEPSTAPAPGPDATPVADIQSTAPDANAADLYSRAISSLTTDTPSDTPNTYPTYWPSSPDWRATAATAWNADAKARELVHQARSLPTATWPSDLSFYNTVRPLANHIADAAVYADSQGNDAQAIELFRDINHMADLLVDSPTKRVTPLIVGIGMQALAVYHLNLITSGVVLTNDPRNGHDLQVQTAKDLIEQLLDRPERIDELRQAMGGESSPQWRDITSQRQRLVNEIRIISVEQQLAAMSLACHVFKFDKARWPNSLDELIPAYLPRPILDPWGNGSQTLGYALIKNALPDGSDRPLVYDRQYSFDGLYYFPNHREFGVYTQFDASTRPLNEIKHYGQFRDVTSWEPLKNFTGPTALPIPQ